MAPSELPAAERTPHQLVVQVVPSLIVASLAGLLYLNALHNPFVYDDYRLILENQSILNLWDLAGITYQDMARPLVNLSYAVDASLWGSQPFGFHLTNLALHMLNTVLVLGVARRVSEDGFESCPPSLDVQPGSVAIAAAVLFAAHPLMTQAVGYISGRSEVLYTAWFLAGFFCARRWLIQGGTRWWLATAIFWALSLASKESALMLPVVLLCYDKVMLDGDTTARRRRWSRLHLPLLSAAVLAGTLRVLVLTEIEFPQQAPVDWRFAFVAVDVIWRYLLLLAFPRGQSIFHEVPPILDAVSPGAVIAVGSLALMLWTALALRRSHPVVTFGLLWFLLMLVPSGVLFALGRGEPMAEHRVYGASIGVFLAAGSAFGVLSRRVVRRGPLLRWVLYGLTTLFVLQLSARTLIRNTVWSDPAELAREAVRQAPRHWVPRLLLGEALRVGGRCDEAIPEYRLAIEFGPGERFGYLKLAGCLIEAGRLPEATATFQQLSTVDPASSEAITGMGLVAVLLDRPTEARAYLMKVVEPGPAGLLAEQLLGLVTGTLDPVGKAALCAGLQRAAPLTAPPAACR